MGIDQAETTSSGNVLSDLLDSGAIPEYRLTQIFRQAAGSLIVRNAHRLLGGDRPELPDRGDHESDFYFFPAESADECFAKVDLDRQVNPLDFVGRSREQVDDFCESIVDPVKQKFSGQIEEADLRV